MSYAKTQQLDAVVSPVAVFHMLQSRIELKRKGQLLNYYFSSYY
jgi:hypothetical protein